MKSKFIVFDLDGTLINTLYGIREALNETLKELNIPSTYSLDETKTFIGNGAKVLFAKALKRDFSAEEFNLFLKNYEKDQYISPFFPNVIETLKELKNRGYRLFCNSNKPDSILQKLMANKFGESINLFDNIIGDSTKFNRKPSPDYVNYIVEKFDLTKDGSYYVGDSVVDLNTAKNSSLKSIIVSYGYGDNEFKNDTYITKVIDNFEILLDIAK